VGEVAGSKLPADATNAGSAACPYWMRKFGKVACEAAEMVEPGAN
jgi:hypothetical protein